MISRGKEYAEPEEFKRRKESWKIILKFFRFCLVGTINTAACEEDRNGKRGH